MTKAQIHFSNAHAPLIEVLKAQLYPKKGGPFEKRLIVVPHMALKDQIMQAFAKDPEMRVAAGMQITSSDQAYSLLTKKSLPSKMELSLFLEHALMGMIEEVEELKSYFDLPVKEERIGPFCDALATYFLRYKAFGKPDLPKWQEELYAKLPWVFPAEFRGKVAKYSVHLFGFSFVPKSTFAFFEKIGAQFYLISPCAIFWGDFYSEKELATLGKGVSEGQLDLFAQAFEDQNLLLANLGKVGRKCQMIVEDVPSEEYYCAVDDTSALGAIKQSLLEGSSETPPADESIAFVSASGPYREVEILKDHLISLFEKGDIEPKDVQVFVPDLKTYAPFIEAVFEELAHTRVVTDRQRDAFDQLIALPKTRFSKESILKLLPSLSDSFDLGALKRWIESVEIKWGFSKEQRHAFYLRDLPEEDIHTVAGRGTWHDGFRRLILGLGQMGGEACAAISLTEIEEFNRFYTTLCDLSDDLTPLFDGTRWTIPTWLRYLACLMESYLPIDPSHELYKELLRLAAKTDHLDEHPVSFEGVERVLLQKKIQLQNPPHLQSIRFAALSDGCILPSKVIAFLGMEEEAFPRREESASLYFGERDYRPKQIDLDKYLFLQGVLHAQEHLFLSYIRDEEGKRGASLLLQELMGQLQGSEIVHHPESATDPRYFGGDLASYNRAAYAMATQRVDPKPHTPLIPSFYEGAIFEEAKGGEVSLKHLFKFARHPLRYYLHEVLGIYPQFEKRGPEDFLIDPFKKAELVREALLGGDIREQLPANLFGPYALSQIEGEVEEWREASGGLPLRQHKIELEVGPYQLKGSVDTMTEKGWLLRGKDTLEDRIRFFPQLLIAKELGVPVIFVRDLSQPGVEGSLEAYLDYFSSAKQHPSPLVPKLAKAFFDGDPAQLHKGLKQLDDEVWAYLYLRDPLPKASTLLQNWSSHLSYVFGGIHANV